MYNAFCVTSDMLHTKVGTITANESRFVEWKSVDGSYEATQYADWKTPLDGMFPKKRLIDILRPSNKTVDSLMNLQLPAGVDIEIKL